MSDLLDTIESLAGPTSVYTVTRRERGAMVKGHYVPSDKTSTFEIVASVQPATGMQRVVGGRDQWEDEQGQRITDVRVVYCVTELRAREATNDPDVIHYRGYDYEVFRQERYEMFDDLVYFRVVMTAQLDGAA